MLVRLGTAAEVQNKVAFFQKYVDHRQWRSKVKCRLGPTTKVPPFATLKFAYKNFKWNRKFMFRANLKI